MAEMINKEELRERIMGLEGLTEEEKVQMVHLLDRDKKYGLVWEEKVEDIEERMREEMPVLTEVKERAIIAEAEGSPNHILIEGDNLAALTALSYTHEGKIDVIYIDPPYNTGNKDFVYNDSFVDTEDSYRHSKWLSFMDKRLRIAKRLLSDKGVIFISIDDNEQANLKLLCDEVFGEGNFISNFIWKSRQNKDNRNISGVSIDHEYIICYSKVYGIRALMGSERKTDQYTNPDNDPRGPWTSANMAGLLDAEQRPNCHYDLINPQTGINYGKPKMGWRYDKNTMSRLIAENKIIWPDTPSGRPRKKSFLSEICVVLPGFSSIVGTDIYTRTGTKQLDDLFQKRPFDFPKPYELVEQFIKQTTNQDSTILDFFAGSGTTLHATMQLNAEDGGKRRCILVTNNENNICEEVTYERNRRVINGYTNPKGEHVEGLRENSLRYYRTEFLPREMTFTSKQALMRASADLLCIKEDIYHEEREFGGMRFKPSVLRYFKDASTNSAQARQMLLVFDERVIEHIVPLISKLEGVLKVYVFSNGAYAYEDEFREVKDKVELCALPEAILQAYHKVLPQREEEAKI